MFQKRFLTPREVTTHFVAFRLYTRMQSRGSLGQNFGTWLVSNSGFYISITWSHIGKFNNFTKMTVHGNLWKQKTHSILKRRQCIPSDFVLSRCEAKMFLYLKGVRFKPRTTLGITMNALFSPVWYSKYTVQLKCWDSPKALSINVILVLNK